MPWDPSSPIPRPTSSFERIFGAEVHKRLLIVLLNALLELDDERKIVDPEYLTPEQHVPVEELKLEDGTDCGGSIAGTNGLNTYGNAFHHNTPNDTRGGS